MGPRQRCFYVMVRMRLRWRDGSWTHSCIVVGIGECSSWPVAPRANAAIGGETSLRASTISVATRSGYSGWTNMAHVWHFEVGSVG
jgi:hypothetical protein